jgi:SAM-dependent methyltransferase
VTGSPTQIVRDGYDAIAERWESWSAQVANDPRRAWLDSLVQLLPPDASVGVDISAEQLRRARARVPEATFVEADVTTVELTPESVDAVVALYVFNHVPRELLGAIFERIRSWLRPGGHFLATLGAGDTDAWRGEWLGVPMFFSSYPPERNSELLRHAGLELVRDECVTIDEPEGPVTFQWVLARR